jgi:hypothetical protein
MTPEQRGLCTLEDNWFIGAVVALPRLFALIIDTTGKRCNLIEG